MVERRIDVNTATAEELTKVPGIGPVLARRIVSYREEVGPFVELSQITGVSGIGESSYRSTVEHLLVAAPEEALESAVREPPKEPGEGDTAAAEVSVDQASALRSLAELEEDSWPKAEALPVGGQIDEEELTLPGEALEEGSWPEAEALPVGEQIDEKELTFPGDALEEEPPPQPLRTDEMLGQTMEEALPGPGDAPEEEVGENLPEAEPMLAEHEKTSELEEADQTAEAVDQPAVEGREAAAVPSDTGLSATSAAMRPERAPSRSWWRRLSWLWTALLGGLLGLAFSLVVLSGINGSLDVGHSRAVLNIKARMDTLTTDIGSLQGDVDGLRTRLDAMEELAVRMDRSEAVVGDLQEVTGGLSERADALQARVVALVAEVESISEQVETVQDQAEETRGFFQALRALLNDFLGDAEGNP